MNPQMGLAVGGIFGVAAYWILFVAFGLWAFAFTPLVFVVMVLGVALGERL